MKTEIHINDCGYLAVAWVDMPAAEILKEADAVPEGHTMVFTQQGATGATGIYNADLKRCEYHGGRIYTGLGAALGWEKAMQIGPHCRLFEIKG